MVVADLSPEGAEPRSRIVLRRTFLDCVQEIEPGSLKRSRSAERGAERFPEDSSPLDTRPRTEHGEYIDPRHPFCVPGPCMHTEGRRNGGAAGRRFHRRPACICTYRQCMHCHHPDHWAHHKRYPLPWHAHVKAQAALRGAAVSARSLSSAPAGAVYLFDAPRGRLSLVPVLEVLDRLEDGLCDTQVLDNPPELASLLAVLHPGEVCFVVGEHCIHGAYGTTHFDLAPDNCELILKACVDILRPLRGRRVEISAEDRLALCSRRARDRGLLVPCFERGAQKWGGFDANLVPRGLFFHVLHGILGASPPALPGDAQAPLADLAAAEEALNRALLALAGLWEMTWTQSFMELVHARHFTEIENWATEAASLLRRFGDVDLQDPVVRSEVLWVRFLHFLVEFVTGGFRDFKRLRRLPPRVAGRYPRIDKARIAAAHGFEALRRADAAATDGDYRFAALRMCMAIAAYKHDELPRQAIRDRADECFVPAGFQGWSDPDGMFRVLSADQMRQPLLAV